MIAISIDPGLAVSGVAVWQDKHLVAASAIKGRKNGPPLTARIDQLSPKQLKQLAMNSGHVYRAKFMVRAIKLYCGPLLEACDLLIVEWPKVRREKDRARRGSDPNRGVVPLAAVCEGLAVLAPPAAKILAPWPEHWKGNHTPKPKRKSDPYIPEGRVRAALTPGELSLVPEGAALDVIDAVGLGLWACGRYSPARVYPGTE